MEIKIRAINLKEDLIGATRCFNEGFEHTLWPTLRHASPSLHRDLVRFYSLSATDCLAAEVDGEIHAIIFGAAPFRAAGMMKSYLFYTFYILPRALLNLYGMNWLAYKHFFRLFYGFLPILFRRPQRQTNCEVLLFTSTKQHRSRGLGRALMDAFIEKVRERGFAGSYVCTDTALAYRFYEVYGFRLECEFPQKGYKHSIPDRTFDWRIYYLKIRD
jgi:GNAT superfamily N-acetyltransferase